MRCELDSYIYKSNQSSQARDKLSSMTCQETCVDYLYDFLQDREASVLAPKSKPLCMAGNKVWLAGYVA